jgi:hypothetical protein
MQPISAEDSAVILQACRILKLREMMVSAEGIESTLKRIFNTMQVSG